MAVFVLMAFDNDEHAKEWIKIQQVYAERRRNLTEEQVARIVSVTDNYEVTAVYKKPTMFCEGGHPHSKRFGGFTKGKKWEWWVCAMCHKPKEMYFKTVVEHNPLGRNLLHDEAHGFTAKSPEPD